MVIMAGVIGHKLGVEAEALRQSGGRVSISTDDSCEPSACPVCPSTSHSPAAAPPHPTAKPIPYKYPDNSIFTRYIWRATSYGKYEFTFNTETKLFESKYKTSTFELEETGKYTL